MGVNVSRYKTLAFGLSCFFTGLAGALLAHFLSAFNYEAFLTAAGVYHNHARGDICRCRAW